jgi:hypothetical protein
VSRADEYHFADFTRTNYRRLIRLARERFVFTAFHEIDRSKRFVLWRHDVDFSVHSALKLAAIEAEEGVRSTYFLHLHSRFYNLLDPEITARVRSILSMGHRIGLHFDMEYSAPGSVAELERLLRLESGILESIFGAPVHVFSFHNPSPFALSCQEWSYAGLINTYAAFFQKEVPYCSDSNGYWRFRRLEDVLQGNDPRLHVLTHPGWWQDEPMSPRKRLERCIAGRAQATLAIYEGVLRDSGRMDLDDD